ncbi:response regulator [Desulfomonile tiedjei]|uniref:Response regulator containing a CheY-like receiver domain and an HD-GYP domain n=1 Tax=Desulfomonile tiedjei (strain ATCC 49306 / DSM 6799 / DCB-1) TaxID=706587 RepID=I4C0H4_DESTA|nr:response regulator [Desulfomonile tiedjei]AFM23065.1 response regulator containing a CheY-like receiver domain and an HD-GYP domain [Desulfomonile tiedjei DSM 6799]
MKLNILLIDDLKPLLTLMERGLKKLGQNLFTAESGLQGLEIFENTHIDVIISDIEMTGMDGWEVARRITESSARRRIPKPVFILLTGWGSEPLIAEKALAHGVDKILTKPVEIRKLLEIVQELIGGKPFL